MPKVLARRTPLDEIARSGVFIGPHGNDREVTLSVMEYRTIVEVAVAGSLNEQAVDAFTAATGTHLPGAGRALRAGGEAVVLWIGPGRWLLVADERHRLGDVNEVRETLGRAFFVTDLSHGLCIVRVSGRAARQVLSAGLSIDLHPTRFKVDDGARSVVVEMNVMVHQVDDAPTYDFYVERDVSIAFWEWICANATVSGYRVTCPYVGV